MAEETKKTEEKKKLGTGAIIGISCGVIFLLGLLITLGIIFLGILGYKSGEYAIERANEVEQQNEQLEEQQESLTE